MDYTHLYSTRIQTTYDDDHLDIISLLASAHRKNPALEVLLINYYKGLPVSFKAAVVAVGNDSLDLDVNPQQAVAISDGQYTFIRSGIFKHDLVAKAQYVSVKRKAVTLNRLCYVEIMAERRNHLRLKIVPPIAAFYVADQGTVHGLITELSTAGAIMTVESHEEISTGEEILLSFPLPDATVNATNILTVPAKLITVIDDVRPSRYIFGLSPDRITEKHIAKYLFNRQIEIVRELKDFSDIW